MSGCSMILCFAAVLVPCEAYGGFSGRIQIMRKIPRLRLIDSQHGDPPLRRRTAAKCKYFRRSMHLGLFNSPQAETTKAVLGIMAAATFGSRFENRVPDSGILATLVSSAILSNLGLAPSRHAVYFLCWTVFLPSSLTLLLLGMNENSSFAVSGDEESTAKAIQMVSLPFVLASIGSILGCTLSFLLCLRYPNALLPPENAAVAMACLAASYVGGSVNFFATSAIVATHQHTMASIVSSMATADLVVLAIYFVMLSAALKSRRMKRLFDIKPRKGNLEDDLVKRYKVLGVNDRTTQDAVPALEVPLHMSPLQTLSAGLAVSSLALMIVRAATKIESRLAEYVPGTACGVIAAVTPIINRFMTDYLGVWPSLRQTAAPLSTFLFLLFFASIGIEADLGAVLQSGPACLVLCLLALLVHGVFTLIASVIAKRTIAKRIQLEDILVASNAAIGGPATAATFCSRIPGRRQKGLTMAATVWGVVGYAVGTTVGVTVYHLLHKLM